MNGDLSLLHGAVPFPKPGLRPVQSRIPNHAPDLPPEWSWPPDCGWPARVMDMPRCPPAGPPVVKAVTACSRYEDTCPCSDRPSTPRLAPMHTHIETTHTRLAENLLRHHVHIKATSEHAVRCSAMLIAVIYIREHLRHSATSRLEICCPRLVRRGISRPM
ncbi:unnamed protein product [Mesocestoides corti]|uniref:Cyclin N-terminal domain-containing protein n=1 Tax=Mesocestoides corti TaxID=53468 RepID=A0A0R3U5T9_MESCO|nr:unnamed protein product [Mesocestoides corti]